MGNSHPVAHGTRLRQGKRAAAGADARKRRWHFNPRKAVRKTNIPKNSYIVISTSQGLPEGC
jgi:hypothetical protein